MPLIGKVLYWNQSKGYGFISFSEQQSILEAPSQKQYFFHHSNFTKYEVPVLGAYVVFSLGAPFSAGQKVQAVGVRFATAQEIAAHLSADRNVGAAALAAPEQRDGGVN
jgi:cold shock CspA family protein